MGAGIAQVAACSEFDVCVTDISQDRLDWGKNYISSSLARLVKKEKISSEDETVANAIVELESIKDKIKETEENNEYYRSETNHGLTVVGTLMEQMIDNNVPIIKKFLGD